MVQDIVRLGCSIMRNGEEGEDAVSAFKVFRLDAPHDGRDAACAEHLHMCLCCAALTVAEKRQNVTSCSDDCDRSTSLQVILIVS